MTVPGRETDAIWRPYFWAAVGLALTAGFSLGGGLFVAVALRLPLGPWWTGAAQAHGHLQLFGWAGLLVVGVGLHFLPRLRGAKPIAGRTARVAAGLLLGGLLLRLVAQPFLAGSPSPGGWLWLLMVAGGLELAGASIALGGLIAQLRHGPPLTQREGYRQVRPFLVVVAAMYWLALGVNLAGFLEATLHGRALLAPWAARTTVLVALYGFLIPICVAMSARLLPLYCRTFPPRSWLLQSGLAANVVALALRLLGEQADWWAVAAVGQVLQAVALVFFALGLGVFGGRRTLPRQQVRLVRDLPQLQVLSAYVWLVLTAVLLCWSIQVVPGTAQPRALRDAELHLLGLGYLTLLILGIGAHLLTGFARSHLRSVRLSWVTLLSANAAVVLRVGPLLLGVWHLPVSASAVQAVAGGCAVVALVVFVLNLDVWRPARA